MPELETEVTAQEKHDGHQQHENQETVEVIEEVEEIEEVIEEVQIIEHSPQIITVSAEEAAQQPEPIININRVEEVVYVEKVETRVVEAPKIEEPEEEPVKPHHSPTYSFDAPSLEQLQNDLRNAFLNGSASPAKPTPPSRKRSFIKPEKELPKTPTRRLSLKLLFDNLKSKTSPILSARDKNNITNNEGRRRSTSVIKNNTEAASKNQRSIKDLFMPNQTSSKDIKKEGAPQAPAAPAATSTATTTTPATSSATPPQPASPATPPHGRTRSMSLKVIMDTLKKNVVTK